ncbi:translocation/assembly module TamB domain-containing protein [Oceanibaculum sp.]|uniref:translocation/assembly module TamB domain-containing protein n=1 Tax=Oceanibaculum sp. TaxID=1903597 RepID=UPI00258268BF|nr:translocation/assembly module TamB domain-containing protein [Oceanibaculum sp.]MCH2394966.1 translocation/assembly module TamB domain-containing protein [Oceanibaculum sp.]
MVEKKDTEKAVPAAPKKRPAKPRRRTGRRILLAILLLPLLLAGLLTGAVLALNTGPGRDLAERLANDLLAGQVEIAGIDRLAPFEGISVGRITLRDAEGPWLTIERAVLDWSPLDLLDRRLTLDALTAERVSVLRQPVAGAAEDSQTTSSPFPLPVDIRLERLRIDRIELAEPVAGMAATLTAEGKASLPRDGNAIDIALDARRLDAPAEASVLLRYDATSDSVEARLTASEPENGVIAGLLDLPGRPAVEATLNAEGPLDGLTARLTASAGPEIGITADVTVEGSTDRHVMLDSRVRAGPLLPPELRPVPAEELHIALDAVVPAAGPVRIGRLALRDGPAEITLAGTANPISLDFDLTATATGPVERYASLAGIDLAGMLRLDAIASGHPDDAGFDITASLADAALDGAPLPLLGNTAELTAAGRIRQKAGELQLDHVGLAGEAATLDGNATLSGNFQKVAASLALDLPDMAEAGRLADLRMAGAASAFVNMSGSWPAGVSGEANLDWRNARLEGETLGAVTAALSLDRLAQDAETGTPAAEGRLRLTASPRGLAATGETRFTVAGNRLQLDGLALDSKALALQGALAIDMERQLAAGRLKASSDDLATLAALAGQKELNPSGSMALAVELADRSGRQHAGLVLEGSSLALDGIASLQRLRLEAQLADVTGTPRGPVALRAEGLEADGQRLDSLILDADLEPQGGGFSLQAEGPELSLDSTGSIAVAKLVTLRLDRLDATVRKIALALRQPATLRYGPSLKEIEGLDLAIEEKARLTGQARLTDDAVAARLSLSGLPLALAKKLGAGPDLAGTASAELSLQGKPTDPSGDFRVTLSGIALNDPAAPDLPPASATLEGRLRGGQLDANLALDRIEGAHIEARASLPVRLDLAAGTAALPPDGALSGRLEAQAELSRITLLALALGEDRLEGSLTAGLDLGGTVRDPRLSGEAEFADGRYMNDMTGATLQNIAFRITGDGDSLTLRDLGAHDSTGGTLSGEGRVRFEGEGLPKVDIRLRQNRLRILNREEGTAYASGTLSLESTAEDMLLTGRITVDEADIRIPNRLPPSVTVLDVREINRDARTNVDAERRREEARQARARQAEDDEDGFGPNLVRLDIAIEIPGQVYVRGRGLESEFSGRIEIAGTAAAPAITGDVSVVRGQFDFAGRRFVLDRGTIDLLPDVQGEMEIGLDILAVADVGDIQAQVAITGPVSRPDIALSSSPPLPRDEILSRILFGSSVARLNAVQAARLAQTALELTGTVSSVGMVDDLRQSLGLDTLEVDGGDVNGASVRAGRYLSEDLFVGVSQGFGAESTALLLEYKVLPNLKIESRLGAATAGDIGLIYEKRY